MADSRDSSPEPMGDASPVYAAAQPPPLSPANLSEASGMAEEVNRLEDQPEVIEDEGDGDDLDVNMEK